MRCERCHTRTSACSRAKLRFGCTSMSSLDAPAFEETRSSPEDELVTAVRTGDSAAFDRLAARYHGDLYAHCYRMLRRSSARLVTSSRRWGQPSSPVLASCGLAGRAFQS